jgi:hypothetical protein
MPRRGKRWNGGLEWRREKVGRSARHVSDEPQRLLESTSVSTSMDWCGGRLVSGRRTDADREQDYR